MSADQKHESSRSAMKHETQSVPGEGAPVDSDQQNADMPQFRYAMPLFRWIIVAGGRERAFIAPRAEDALVMFRACSQLDAFLQPTGCGYITDIRCEQLETVSGISNETGEQK